MSTVLFDVEIKYQKIKEYLRKPSTTRFKLLALTNFIKYIIELHSQERFKSYYLELSDTLINLIKLNQFDYFSPEEIEELICIVKKIYEGEEKESIHNILSENKSRILNILNGNPGKEENIESLSNSLNIVLVEKNDGSIDKTEFSSGVIFKLILDSSLNRKSEIEKDKVEFKNLVNINETKIVEHLSDVVAIAKSECRKQNIETYSYNFSFFFSNKNYIYSGTSLGIGAICLAYNSILVNNLNNFYYRFKNDTVFSAEVDESGNLLKLDKDILRIKLQAVFYSNFNKFVIPEDNVTEAKEILNGLKQKYPNRKLELIPVNNYENVFKNLNIAEVCKLKFNEKLKSNYKKHNKVVNMVLSIMTLSVISLFVLLYLIPHLDRNPIKGKFENGRFVVYNKYNIEIWAKETNGYVGMKEELFSKRIYYQGISIADIDNDGENEIIYIDNFLTKELKNIKTIICCEGNGTEKWKYSLPSEKMHYDWESDELKGDWVFEQLFVDDLFGDGNKEIVANACYKPYFPDRLILLNSKGELISEYYNSGYFNYITDYDIDGDNKKEVVAVGVNNYPGYRCGAMVVFDSDFLSGSSFKTDPLHSGKAGLEKYYILFPKTFMTKFNVSNFNIADYIMQNTERCIVNVLDGETEEKFIDNPHLLYEFDKSLNVVNIGTSNQFQKQYETLLSQNKILPIPNMLTYLDSLKKEVRYWNGEEFVKYPSINKNYLKVLNSLKTVNK
jgi:hypothetical protein